MGTKESLLASASPWYRLSTRNPNRRLFELLKNQSMQEDQQIVFLSNGGGRAQFAVIVESASRASAQLVPCDHAADGHDSDRQRPAGDGRRREDQQPLRSEVLKTIESIKWYLWHWGRVPGSPTSQFVEMDLEGAAFEKQEETTRKLLKAVEEFSTYIQRNRGFIPNYGERP